MRRRHQLSLGAIIGGVLCALLFGPPGRPIALAQLPWGHPANSAAAAGMFCDQGVGFPCPDVWWGMHAIISTAVGGNAIDVLRASDSTTLTITFLTGGSLDTSSAATFCGGTTCQVTKVYEQIQTHNICSASSCPMRATGINTNPGLTFNCLNTTLPCMVFSGSPHGLNSSIPDQFVPQAQPYTMAVIAERTGSFTSVMVALGGDAAHPGTLGMDSSVNAVLMTAGTAVDKSGNDNTWHRLAGTFNGASSIFGVDGTTSNVAVGADGIADLAFGFEAGDSAWLVGNIFEGGAWFSGLTSGQLAALQTFQHNYCGC